MASREVKRQLFENAAEMLRISKSSDMIAVNGFIFQKSLPDIKLSIQEVVQYCLKIYGKPITGDAIFNPTNVKPPDQKTGYGNYCPAYAFGAQAAEVEVDVETGKVIVLDFAAAHDVGKAVNPLLIEGQINGGISMGIGYGLFEEIICQNGSTLNSSFHKYKIVNSTEMPPVKTILLESEDPNGPFGAIGVGEPTTIPTAPAIANAVFNAVGVRIKNLPITPEKILKALKKQEKG